MSTALIMYFMKTRIHFLVFIKKMFLPLIECEVVHTFGVFFQVFFEAVDNIYSNCYLGLGSGHNHMGIEPTGEL